MQRSTTDALRRSMEEYLRLRKTKFLIIDEAHHLFLTGNKQKLECQFESLKSLTIETGVTILLVGTYRLLDILDQSGQLTRRSQVVNFPRYDMRKSEDLKNFRKVLGYLEQKLTVFPLRWYIEVYRACSEHMCTLEDHCPYCGKTQPYIPRFPDIGICDNCRKPLAGTRPRTDIPRFQLWVHILEQREHPFWTNVNSDSDGT